MSASDSLTRLTDPRPLRRLRATRWLSLTHRWLGIVMGLFFAMWFSSGAVMLFIPFPELTEAQRSQAMQPIDSAALAIPPAQAAAATTGTAPITRLSLIQGLDGPIYVVGRIGAPLAAIDGRLGTPLPAISPEQAGRIAERFAPGRIASAHGPYAYDQWIVHQRFDPYRPLYRVDLDDGAATRLYVSARSGEVVQRTTHRERLANYVGSVVHWIYPAILRRYPVLWSYTVWAISLVGIAMASSGLAIGVVRSSVSLRGQRKARLSPFRGLFGWHHLAGLSAGLFLLAWIFSGWLSVDHGLIFPTGSPSQAQIAAFRGITLEQAAQRVPLATLARLDGSAAINLNAVDQQPVLSGYRAHSAQSATWDAAGHPLERVPSAAIAHAAARAWPGSDPSVHAIGVHDPYAHLVYSPLPGNAVRVRLGDARDSWVHVDPTSGRILEVMDRRRRLYRWLFNGLHTFDFAGLADHELVRKALMLPLLGAGLLLSLTGVVLGTKRLARSLRH